MQAREGEQQWHVCVADAKHKPHPSAGRCQGGYGQHPLLWPRGFLPLAAVLTSSTTHQCPTARESNHSFTSPTQ